MESERVWTIKAALDWCTSYLSEKGDHNPKLSAEWLLSAATGLSRVEIYAYHDRPLGVPERATLRDGVRCRAAGEPLQYVTGEVAFRHLVVKVRPGVLIPRPETEVLVDEALRALKGIACPLVADVCAGSGVVALSITQEHPGARVWATDVSADAVALACENAERLGLAECVQVVEGDLLGGLPDELRGRLDAVVANPPYIPTGRLAHLPAEVADYEPRLALDGGADGLSLFRRLACDAAGWLKPEGAVIVELDESRVGAAGDEALEWYLKVSACRDLSGRKRVIVARDPKNGRKCAKSELRSRQD
ncbi:MAG: peptide chain release factor N(5)-glutamine methyltransferase [Coriobacteriia bacterium]|nr:peptide chain release factor N(5)-glutamine methyltransferase [Coriobacteriia bacterium]